MENLPFNFAESEERAGFRLHRFEVFNWGTFDKHVWKIEPTGHNALLTGDIGSGKSTLVDALTTLLVPAQKIVYNQAAGAARKERDIHSYVRGHYKTEKDSARFAARAVSLRQGDTYSVILGFFANEGFGQAVTLAQVFWTKGGDNAQPERFYVVADRPLDIASDFANFGKEIADLKKRLRKAGHHIFDSFSQYAGEFRRRMEIRSEQALELFYQTVSLKSVGNLTDFVREHMLDAPQVKDRIEEIRRNFDNLNRAHTAVMKAKDQIQRLEPLAKDCDHCDVVQLEIGNLTRGRSALHAFFAAKKASLLDKRITALESDHGKASERAQLGQQALDSLRARRSELQRNVIESGGSRLDALAAEIQRLGQEQEERKDRAKHYQRLCENLSLPVADDLEAFHDNKVRAEELRGVCETERKAVDLQRIALEVACSNRRELVAALSRELESLRGRSSNIPAAVLEIRRSLCDELSIPEDSLAFVGELLQVRQEHAVWEGALERVMHGFGLSLLVPDESYADVAGFVDRTHLGGRFVYFRVRADGGRNSPRPSDRRQLCHKIEVRPDSRFKGWLEQDLIQRFDYICCESVDEFQREGKALTRQGQLKSGGRRHEKDDRFRLDDRSHYVLGWSNASKIRALEETLSQREDEQRKDGDASEALAKRLRGIESKRDAAGNILYVQDFKEIDWRTTAKQVADLDEESRRITASSDVLRTLQAALQDIEVRLREAEVDNRRQDEDRVRLEQRLSDARALREQSTTTLNLLPEAERADIFPRLEEMQPDALGDRKLTLESCDNCQTAMREWLQGELDAKEKRRLNLRERIAKQMQDYKAVYPIEAREADSRWEAADEFRAMLRTLRDEDLPRHEERFKQFLNEGTINDIALFQNQLDKECQDIRDKIGFINKSLRGIEYSQGTFIELVLEHAPDVEVRDFRQQLRACLGETLASGTENELYNEHKFLQVKAIIDRFNGREGMAEMDQRWTRKVADVRNWFDFLVNERWKETDEVKETYSDSSGKSGGQKEKLAYTILASALAYQFGLGWQENRSRPFRFVMIDEAFGRGSDDSARYALNLFKGLNLQVLVVTPLQKIHVIEDYVRTVHFVHNTDGKTSQLKNLTIEQFREERARRRRTPETP